MTVISRESTFLFKYFCSFVFVLVCVFGFFFFVCFCCCVGWLGGVFSPFFFLLYFPPPLLPDRDADLLFFHNVLQNDSANASQEVRDSLKLCVVCCVSDCVFSKGWKSEGRVCLGKN